ncbi:MAG: response regulator transcription factor [Bacteroidales bacterium]|nr:response regulator transcription factor [Bacteroidales bacterium]
MKTKCLIVDDEPLAIEVIESHIKKIDSLKVVGTCQNAFEAFNALKEKQVDLMFLDIHMPEVKGTQLVKGLPHPPKIVFTTAYREYALEGYELNVLDYLLKPISFERFMLAISRYNETTFNTSDVMYVPQNISNAGFIHIRDKKKIHRIASSEIQFIECAGDYLRIHTPSRKITARCTIASIQNLLPDAEFMRIHRSYIVALQHIESFSANTIVIGGKEFPIGTTYKNTVFKALKYDRPD